MDIGAAFTYVFDDEDWLKKLGIGGGIALVAFILSFILIGVVLFLPIFGYMLQTLKNVRDGHNKPLPQWDDFGGFFKNGLMIVIIMLVYNIPTILLYCASIGGNIAVQQLDSDAAAAAGLVVLCLNCLAFLIYVLCNLMVPGAFIFFAQDDSLGSAFQFGKIINFIKNNIGDYIIVILLVVVAGLISQFGVILCFVGFFFTYFWSRLVIAHLYGQLARKAQAGW